MTDQPAPEDDVILEPGDPGYEEQQNPPGDQPEGVPIQTQGEHPASDQEPMTPGEMGPPGEDLQHYRDPRETDAEFLARTRHTVVHSESPTDIVPNTPQIGMGERVPVEGTDNLEYSSPPPELGVPAGGQPEAVSTMGDQPGTENVRAHEDPTEQQASVRAETERPPEEPAP